MSINLLLNASTAGEVYKILEVFGCNVQQNGSFGGTLTVNDLIITNNIIIPKTNVTKIWDLSTVDNVTMNGSGTLTINLINTALIAGGNSALLQVNNNMITSTSIVNMILTDYSGIPLVFNNAITFYGLPTPVVYQVVNGSFQILIINDGFGNMGATDTFNLDIKIS